jgi:type III pantothenate kinase
MSLLIDCGNTRCKITRLQKDGELAPVVAIAHDSDDFIDQLKRYCIASAEGEPCYFASVANAALNSAIESSLAAAGFSVTRIGTRAEALGVRIAYPNPQQLGVDRFLGLLAAHEMKKSVLIVSAGSALTVDLLQASGQHRGGMITATETIIHEAMQNRFANFRNLSGSAHGFSSNTSDALSSGARYMVLGLIEKSWREASHMLNEPQLAMLITGGDAEALLPHLPDNVMHQANLVLQGLALWADYLEKL